MVGKHKIENDRTLAIRKRMFLGGILLGATLGGVLFPQGWLSGAILGALLGGCFFGSMGEAYVGGNRDDVIGAGVTLGLFAGIAAALSYHPLTGGMR